MRQGIHLRGYGQRDPVNEYTREAFDLFQMMVNQLRENVTRNLMLAQVHVPTLEELIARHQQQQRQEIHAAAPDDGGDAPRSGPPSGIARGALATPTHIVFNAQDPATWVHTPRNAACPCGSGKKYKHCHGAAG